VKAERVANSRIVKFTDGIFSDKSAAGQEQSILLFYCEHLQENGFKSSGRKIIRQTGLNQVRRL
jgi:hypothetical protein